MDFTLGSQYPGKYKYRRSLFRPHMVSACGKRQRTTSRMPGVKSKYGLIVLVYFMVDNFNNFGEFGNAVYHIMGTCHIHAFSDGSHAFVQFI